MLNVSEAAEEGVLMKVWGKFIGEHPFWIVI